jgi:hypothetical protein
MAGRSGGSLTGAIRRWLGRDVGGLVERLNRLTALAAEDLADGGQPANLGSGLWAGAAIFLRGYVVRGGWREGRLGLLVAMLSAIFPVLSRMRAGDVLEAREAAVAEAAKVSRMRGVVGLAR